MDGWTYLTKGRSNGLNMNAALQRIPVRPATTRAGFRAPA